MCDNKYKITPLVSLITDPNLVNAIGAAIDDDILYLVASGTNLLLRYNLKGQSLGAGITTPASPTGLALNPLGSGFLVGGQSALLVVVTNGGVIAAYNPTTTPASLTIMVTTPGAVYKGVAFGPDGFLYVSNFASGYIEQYNSSWTLVGQFTDPTLLAANYGPFGLAWSVNNAHPFSNSGWTQRGLLATFALRNGTLDAPVAGQGLGFVDLFQAGVPIRLISGGGLNAPWGLLPSRKYLLVGNNGDGTIGRYCLRNGRFLGSLVDKCKNIITLPGLWSLVANRVRCGKKKGERQIYTTSGPLSGADGSLVLLRPR